MAGDKERKSRPITFAGGSLTDQPVAGQEAAYDLENLLPPSGGGRGLIPRDGIEHVVELTTDDTSGHVIHKVTLDDVARTQLITVSSAETGRVELIGSHTDMEGLQSVPPKGGGELPDTTPPTLNPILYKLLSQGSGSPVYNAQVTFFDSDSGSVVGPCTLTEVSHDNASALVARGENCLVARMIDVSGDLYLKIWDLETIQANPSGTYVASRSVKICGEGDVDGDQVLIDFWCPVFMYSGNIAFVAAIDKLYKVDLSAGTKELIANPVSGLPEGFIQFQGGVFGLGSTDTAGYLWAYGYKPGDEDDITYIMKIDPVDGSVVNYKDYSSLSDFPALIPLPGGEMMVLMSDDEKFNKLSADAQTFSSYCDGTVFYHEGYPDVDSDHVNLIGTIGLSESIEDGTLSLVNFAENSIIGTPAVFLDETVFPASICGASEFMAIRSGVVETETEEETVYEPQCWLQFVSASTGDETRRAVISNTQTFYEMSVLPLPDAFAYGIKNIQGSRL